MKHSKETTDDVIKLKLSGSSNAEVAFNLNIGKTTVFDIWKKYKSTNKLNTTVKPKICIIDVETSAAKAYCFGRFNQNFSEDNIYEEGGLILVACWRWLGEKKVHSLYMTPEEILDKNDSRIVAALNDVYEEADAVVMHNAKKFDHKVIQTRTLFWYGSMLPVVKVIDTLQIAKSKLRLPSNRLDSIGAYFGLGRKVKTGGIELWAKVQDGSKVSMSDMVTYCKQDTNLLYEVYLVLRALGTAGTAFNAAHYNDDDEMQCRICNSKNLLVTDKKYFTQKGTYKEVICLDCGHSARDTKNTLPKTKRDSLLVSGT